MDICTASQFKRSNFVWLEDVIWVSKKQGVQGENFWKKIYSKYQWSCWPIAIDAFCGDCLAQATLSSVLQRNMWWSQFFWWVHDPYSRNSHVVRTNLIPCTNHIGPLGRELPLKWCRSCFVCALIVQILRLQVGEYRTFGSWSVSKFCPKWTMPVCRLQGSIIFRKLCCIKI